jgi:signal transduction histidine kinase
MRIAATAAVIFSAITVMVMFVMVAAAADEREIIRVGGNRDYPPYELVDKNGQPAGFTVDLLRAIAEVMGMKVEISLGEWAQRHDDLKNGKIDMTLGMNYSEERDKIFDFTSPHTIVQQAIFARRDAPVARTLEELRGKKVILHRNGIMHERLRKLGFEQDLIFADTPAGTLRKLASGEGDYALVALLPGMYIIRENKLTNLVPVARNVASFKFSFAVREGDTELLSRLNEGLAILKKTGQYQIIYDKWLGVLEPSRVPWDKVLQYGAMVMIPLILLLIGTVVWSRTLQRKVAQRTEELGQEVAQKNLALDELRHHQDRLVQADKMASLGILVAGVAHEINNPNSLILLNVPTIREAQQDAETILEGYFREHGDFMYGGIPYSRMRDKLPQLLTEMQEGAKRIRRIVDDLKDFARIDQGHTRELFDLNEVLKTALRLVDATIRSATTRCEVSYADNLPKVLGTPQRVEQVIINLILNACQSLPSKDCGISLVTVCDDQAGTVSLQVRDEGIGIPLEHLSHLSDPFFTTKRENGGTGLGLSVSTTIIQDHGGRLEFSSQTGEGTTVTLTLPTVGKEKLT